MFTCIEPYCTVLYGIFFCLPSKLGFIIAEASNVFFLSSYSDSERLPMPRPFLHILLLPSAERDFCTCFIRFFACENTAAASPTNMVISPLFFLLNFSLIFKAISPPCPTAKVDASTFTSLTHITRHLCKQLSREKGGGGGGGVFMPTAYKLSYIVPYRGGQLNCTY